MCVLKIKEGQYHPAPVALGFSFVFSPRLSGSVLLLYFQECNFLCFYKQDVSQNELFFWVLKE